VKEKEAKKKEVMGAEESIRALAKKKEAAATDENELGKDSGGVSGSGSGSPAHPQSSAAAASLSPRSPLRLLWRPRPDSCCRHQRLG
jgi:hypothetical protein